MGSGTVGGSRSLSAMANQCTVQVKLELGHRAQLRKKVTTEGFTHDWMVFVRGPEQCDIQHFVEKVIFRLPKSFPKPKRVCKGPPYKVEECGYAGFTIPIEIYFRKKEKPKEMCFTYDLFFNMEGNPLVNHLRCEKLTFSNPSKEFRQKLLKAGGAIVLPEDVETGSKPNFDYLMLPILLQSSSSGSEDIEEESTENKPESLSTEEEPPSQQESKSSSKRPPTVKSPMPTAKQLKKSNSKGRKSFSSTSAFTPSSAD